MSFVEHFFLLLTSKPPSAGEAAVLNATLVAIAEHGLVPGVQATRAARSMRRCKRAPPSTPPRWS